MREVLQFGESERSENALNATPVKN